jgi:microcystin-dependent protein
MALTRITNLITSTTGRVLYVNPDDFEATDIISNRGNSPLRPFKTIQRALIEVAKFSYVPGDGGQNDKFDQFTIMLYPGNHIIDNRPGSATASISALTDNSLYDIQNSNNVLYQFNSVRGGVIVPRGASIVGMDLRKTKIIPKFIPDPTATNNGTIQSDYPTTGIFNTSGDQATRLLTAIDDDTRSAIFRITGACYFWQFSIFDGDATIYTGAPNSSAQLTALSGNDALFSRHKLTVFEYACVADLTLYYQKLSNALSIPITDALGQRSEETRIVGPGGIQSDIIRLSSITYNTNIATATTVQSNGTTPLAHGFSIGNQVNVSNATSPLYNGSFRIVSLSSSAGTGTTIDQFSYQMAGIPSSNAVANTNTVLNCTLETDTVDSASPYVFNISLRSTYGMCGLHANGAFASGFKSMVVAQYTGISLQKDDRAYVRYCNGSYILGTGTSCNGATYNYLAHQDINSKYRKNWNHYHMKVSNNGYAQLVSTFAIGYSVQFLVESGGDMSITNSNSSFGANSLISKGFKGTTFTKDSFGIITDVIPPKSLSNISIQNISYLPLDLGLIRSVNDNSKLYLYGYNNLQLPPSTQILNYFIGGKTNDTISVDFVGNNNTIITKSDTIYPNGPSVKTATINTVSSPLKWDSTNSNWYLNVSSTNIGSYIVSGSTGPSPIAYIQRKPDNRTLNDKIYRLRLFIPNTSVNAGPPQKGFVIQPYNSGIGLASAYTNVFYIFDIETYQAFVPNSKDGIYYLTVLIGDIQVNNSYFDNKKFGQNINNLYPATDIDNLVDDPTATVSTADIQQIGLVNVDDSSRSITRESINLWKTNSSISISTNANIGDTETRKISVGAGISVELRRPSILRAGNQTFEYTGYGPGNYSTAFPSRQTRILTASETLYSQSLQESGGVSFYSGLNSNGNLYIGNIVIDPVTGTSTTVNNPTTSQDGGNTAIFTGVTIKNTLNVIGGPNNNATSIFSGPILVNNKLGLSGNLEINSNYSSTSPFTGVRFNAVVANSPTVIPVFDVKVNNSSRFKVNSDGGIVINGPLTGTGISTAVTTGSRNGLSVQTGSNGSGLSYDPNSGIFTYGLPSLQQVTDSGSSTNRAIIIQNTTSSNSTDSGALRVLGGIGIGGALYAGGDIVGASVSSAGAISGSSLSVGSGAITGGSLNVSLGAITGGTITGTTFVGNGTIPVGGIIMWSGSISSVPTGWALCNGSNGTPDLRDRFIVGAGNSYNPGNTGGANNVTLDLTQIPSHTHPVTDPGHTHLTANTSVAINNGGGYGAGSGSGLGPIGNTTITASAFTGIGVGNTGGGQAHENRPPYYALAFIMRTV